MSGEARIFDKPSTEHMDLDNDSDGDDWSEEEESSDPTKCLFCEETSNSVDDAIEHIKIEHNFNLRKLKAVFHMDCYSYLKMINYIRTHNISACKLLDAEQPLWNDEKYLKPVEYEPWLTYDFDSLEEDASSRATKIPSIASFDDIVKLRSLVERLESEIGEKNELLQQAADNIAKMQSSFKNLIEKEAVENASKHPRKELANSVASISLERDDNYFSSYSHYGIHHEMLSDEIRTSSYRDALLGNSEFLKGKAVLDVGCGTAILSMFASKAGAASVVAIDNSEIIYHAMEIARTNQFDNIKFVKGRLEDTDLPIDRFDAVVSEWMGYFLVFEGMLDSIIYARDKHLKLGGTLIPNRCNISIVGHGDEVRHQRYVGFWKNVYEFDMSCMQKDVLREAMVEAVDPKFILTEPNVIVEYDLMRVDVHYSNFSFDFNLRVVADGVLTSFVGYFDTFFDLPNKVSFSTSPAAKQTHWKQVTFFIKDPVQVRRDEVIKGTIVCRRSPRDMRSLAVRIKVFGKEFSYTLD